REPPRAADRDVRGRARYRVAGPADALVLDLRELALGKVRQLEIVKEEVEKFFARQHEPERILAVALAGLARLAAATCVRARKNVPLEELLVARKDAVADPAAPPPEPP